MGDKRVWNHKEERVFIEMWLDPNQREIRAYHSMPFFVTISQKMSDLGYNFTAKQCQQKAKRLTSSYYKAIGNNKISGAPPSNFMWIKEMAVLGDRPAATPKVSIDSSNFFADRISHVSRPIQDEPDLEEDSNSCNSDQYSHDDIAAGATSAPDEQSSIQRPHSAVAGATTTSATDELSSIQRPHSAVASTSTSTSTELDKGKASKDSACTPSMPKKRRKKEELKETLMELQEGMINALNKSDEKWLAYEEKREERERQHEFRILSLLINSRSDMSAQPSQNTGGQSDPSFIDLNNVQWM